MSKHKHPTGEYQVAAIPFRLRDDNSLEVLLITSRETRRWIVPKGWPIKGRKDWQAASVEAQEEAGLRGDITRKPIGGYTYWRRAEREFRLTCVHAFALLVKKEKANWKEKKQRTFQWLDVLNAADAVSEPELSTLIVRLPLNKAIGALMEKAQ